jgi:hypothetical protein
VLGAIACGAIYLVLSQGPTIPVTSNEPRTRTLAYEEKITRPNAPTAAPDTDATQAHATVPADSNPTQTAPAQDAQGAGTATEDGASDMAALPPDESAEVQEPDALPWQHSARPHSPGAPGMNPEGADPMAEQPGEYGYPDDPMAGLPGQEADPNAWPEEQQEWVQVLVSGVGMHGTPSDEAPMLFAFPFGRTLRVVSRYEGWVEVTDPQSAATGWMKAQYLAPAAAPGSPQEAEARYEEDEPRWRRRWLRRHRGGLGDIIGRALGGY